MTELQHENYDDPKTLLARGASTKNADYISPDTLLPTGEVFDPKTGKNVPAESAEQDEGGAPSASDWWK